MLNRILEILIKCEWYVRYYVLMRKIYWDSYGKWFACYEKIIAGTLDRRLAHDSHFIQNN